MEIIKFLLCIISAILLIEGIQGHSALRIIASIIIFLIALIMTILYRNQSNNN